MRQRHADRHRPLSRKEAFNDFGREGRKGRQPPEQPRNGKQLELGRQLGVQMKDSDRHADQQAANTVGRKSAQRHARP